MATSNPEAHDGIDTQHEIARRAYEAARDDWMGGKDD